MRKYLRPPGCGQSILEYSILLCIILSALLIMQFYVKRSYQGRIKQEADSLGSQYSPGHTNSLTLTNTTIQTTTYTGGKTASGAIVDDGMSVSITLSNNTFSKQEVIGQLVNTTRPDRQ